MSSLVRRAKQSAKDRGASGREDAGVCDITLEDLEKKFKEQDGKCFYSGIEFQTDKRAWRPSLERKDPSLGYTYNNTVLCCLEFNGKCQWSHHEILRLVALKRSNEQGNLRVKLETFDIVKKEKIERIPPEDKVKVDEDGNTVHKCKFCTEYKLPTMFNKTISDGCKACVCKNTAEYYATPRGVMQKIVGHASDRTKNWQKKNDPRGGDSDFELSFDYLTKELYKKQEGRCAYSGLPFDFGMKHRKPSLEREDPMLPYTKDNVCLIWMVWNTIDTIAITKHGINNIKPGDKMSWTKDKFDYAYGLIEAKTKREFEDAHGGPMTMDEFDAKLNQVIAEHESV